MSVRAKVGNKRQGALHLPNVTMWNHSATATIDTRLGTAQIVRAQAADLAAILGILAEAARRLQARGIQQWAYPPPPGLAKRMAAEIDAGFAYLARLQATTTPIGTFRLRPQDDYWPADGRAGYVHSLAVSDNAQGYGIGRALLTWVQRTLQEQQRRYLRLDCIATNHALRRYYEAQGFINCGEVVDGDYRLALYELDLSTATTASNTATQGESL